MLLVSVICIRPANAQNSSIQDCLGAIPVCQQIYVEDKSPFGFGNVNEVNGAIDCNPIESNSIWYVFTVNKAGKFGFLLTPNNPADDYDWSLYNITNASCEDISTDASLLVSCNAAGGTDCSGMTGANGDSEFSEQGPNCDNFPPNLLAGFSPFNDLIDVQEGNTYVLFINNFGGSSNGYTLDFGLSGDIGIFDEVRPSLESAVLSDGCDGATIRVQFSEFIQCATIADANFQLDGAGGPFALSLSSVNCDAGGNYSKEFFLNVNPSIAGGNYTLSLNVNESTEALDLCDNPAGPADFQITGPGQAPTIDLGNDTTLCTGATLLLDASQLSGTYLWNDGSTAPSLEVTASGIYSVEVNTGCGIAADIINVNFASGLALDLGPDTSLCSSETLLLDATSAGATYLWSDGTTNSTLQVNQPGTYSVTVNGDCGVLEDAVNIIYEEPISASLNDVALCPGDSFTWDVTTSGATYLWQDGTTTPTFTASNPGTYSVVISNSCESLELSAEVQEGGAVPVIDLGNDTTLCAGENLILNPTVAGADFLWQDGSTGSTYTVTETGAYSVTVSNSCDQQEGSINVTYVVPIDVGIDNEILCPGELISWDVTSSGSTYLWQDGSTEPTFTTSDPGVYSVVITNSCERIELSAEIEVAASLPMIDLGNDTTLCAGEVITFEFDIPDADFLWQDGSTASTYQITQSGVYSLSVENNCENLSDQIQVQVFDPIDIDLGRDTILCPGESFLLNALDENTQYYLWQDNTTESSYLVNAPGLYSVVAGNACEEVSAEINVAECDICDIFVPNTFSPNNDGMNDQFRSFSNCPFLDYNMEIFDRWGNLVYKGVDPEEGWDGQSNRQVVKTGVYIWTMKITVEENGVMKEVNLTGDVTVLK